MFTEYQLAVFENRVELMEKIKAFSNKRGISIWRPIRHDKRKSVVHSWLAEMRTGLFLDKFSDQMKYDKKIKLSKCYRRPDWDIVVKGQRIVCETRRLYRQTAELTENEANSDFERYKKDQSKVYSSQGSVTLSSDYFYGQISKVMEKEDNYRPLILEQKTPFIICIDPTFKTFIGPSDIYDSFIGHGNNGYFFTDEVFNNVTGIFSSSGYGEDFIWFENEKALFPLSQTNREEFARYRYKP